MGGYIGSGIGSVANAAERKQTYSITTATTSLTGLAYTPTKVHVFHNGVRLVDGTDYTATNGTSITLTNAAQNGDEVVVISYPSFQTSDTVSAANGGTFAGNVEHTGTLTASGAFTSLGIDDNATSTAMTLDSSGNVGIGVSPTTTYGNVLQVHDTGTAGASLRLTDSNSGSGTGNGSEVLQLNTAMYIMNRENGLMSFSTNDTERMRILDNGVTLVGKSADNITDAGATFSTGGNAFVRASGGVCSFNRHNDDGVIINIQQAGTIEGQISVSGTTVTYSGGHLGRWSQLTDGSKDTSIVKGTVMTNLDQMAVWSHDAVEAQDAVVDDDGNLVSRAVEAKDAYTEDNEQLNCMAVSSVEGDPNVAGVFVNWDDDDDEFNDMNVAMTGDMVIRIAQGTTVARGDLLMSAGDGTAKPQDDDIVRSKTIAKVTSTNVSHTYDDGSYLVPCVLMAC